MNYTPSSGVVRSPYHQQQPQFCTECLRPLFTFSNWPREPQYRCRNVDCVRFTGSREVVRVPSFSDELALKLQGDVVDVSHAKNFCSNKPLNTTQLIGEVL